MTIEHADHRSTAAIMGHPLHPVVVPIPIGLLTAAAASDIAHLVTGQRFFARMSRWLIGAGVVGGLMAASLGLLDFTTIRAARGTTGISHAAGNATILAMSSASLALRQTSPNRVPVTAMLLTLASGGLLAITGWLGGELSYRKGIGVIPHDER